MAERENESHNFKIQFVLFLFFNLFRFICCLATTLTQRGTDGRMLPGGWRQPFPEFPRPPTRKCTQTEDNPKICDQHYTTIFLQSQSSNICKRVGFDFGKRL
jgi:hypothetical protein